MQDSNVPTGVTSVSEETVKKAPGRPRKSDETGPWSHTTELSTGVLVAYSTINGQLLIKPSIGAKSFTIFLDELKTLLGSGGELEVYANKHKSEVLTREEQRSRKMESVSRVRSINSGKAKLAEGLMQLGYDASDLEGILQKLG